MNDRTYHGHNHHHVDPASGDRRVALAIIVNLALTLVQVVGGVIAGSLALIADALHNLSDAVSLIIAFGARKIARRPADAEMTFGYGRIEMVAALINYTSLILIGLWLAFEAVIRALDPQPVDGWLVVILAGIALIVDAVTALLTFAMSRDSTNIRAAFLHNVADALGSVAVIIAGVAILLWDWRLIDPAVTLLIAGYILWMSMGEIGGVIRMLMLGVPQDMNIESVATAIRETDGVGEVHHIHLWQMQEKTTALQAHVAVVPNRWSDADAIKEAIKIRLTTLGIGHSTLEMECAAHACKDAALIGGA
jgi:cobalt-zinc-cadmium efflux system protein